MKNFNGTEEEYWKERKRLCKDHNINMIRAGCYMNNYYDDFLCETCHCVDSCGEIHKIERKEDVGNIGEEHGEDCVTGSEMNGETNGETSSVTEATDA